jgi:hypothetical protein
MIFGECPYDDCGASFITFMAEQAPVFEKLKCEKCGRFFMEYHSRIEPIGYTMEDFNNEFEVDEATKSIKRKATPQNNDEDAGEQRPTVRGCIDK